MKELLVTLVVFSFWNCGCANRVYRTSCLRVDPKTTVKTAVKTFQVYGMDERERSIFQSAISQLEPEVQKSVKTAVVLSAIDDYFQHGTGMSPGHCHPKTGDICQKRDYDDPMIIWWHEATHAWRARLPSSANDEWEKIAGPVYVNSYGRDRTTEPDYPKDAILREHGSSNHDEDMAIYMEAIYAYVYLDINKFSGVDWKDKRYIQKIRFLYKWGGISKGTLQAVLTLPIQAGFDAGFDIKD